MRQNPHFWKELRKERKEQRITRQYKDSHTGKSDFERCIAMNNEAINWDDVPDRITKDQLYRICHISKSTARYLLQSGKIPCYYTGKQTRCYQIKKEDVIAYLEDRKRMPRRRAGTGGATSLKWKSISRRRSWRIYMRIMRPCLRPIGTS